MNEFSRIKRLPPYVFSITAELKAAARRQGDDIVDLSMGNPDGETPAHIVQKLIEVSGRKLWWRMKRAFARRRVEFAGCFGWMQRRKIRANDARMRAATEE